MSNLTQYFLLELPARRWYWRRGGAVEALPPGGMPFAAGEKKEFSITLCNGAPQYSNAVLQNGISFSGSVAFQAGLFRRQSFASAGTLTGNLTSGTAVTQIELAIPDVPGNGGVLLFPDGNSLVYNSAVKNSGHWNFSLSSAFTPSVNYSAGCVVMVRENALAAAWNVDCSGASGGTFAAAITPSFYDCSRICGNNEKMPCVIEFSILQQSNVIFRGLLPCILTPGYSFSGSSSDSSGGESVVPGYFINTGGTITFQPLTSGSSAEAVSEIRIVNTGVAEPAYPGSADASDSEEASNSDSNE